MTTMRMTIAKFQKWRWLFAVRDNMVQDASIIDKASRQQEAMQRRDIGDQDKKKQNFG